MCWPLESNEDPMQANSNVIAATPPMRILGMSTSRRAAPPTAAGSPASSFAQEHGLSPIPISQLASLLNMPCMEGIDGQRTFDCLRLRFSAGDMLYTPTSSRDRAYIVLSGLALRMREPHGAAAFGAPGQYAFSGRHELIGLHQAGKIRVESAIAAFDTEVLALPVDAMRRVPGIAAFLSEWVVKPLSLAVMRDWQVACRLKALPSYPRVVEGLAHLTRVNMAVPEQQTLDGLELRRVDCCIAEHVMANWLDLPEHDTDVELRKLERYRLIGRKNGRIVHVDAHALAELSAIILRRDVPPAFVPIADTHARQ